MLLLFDPTRGIDAGTKRQICALLRQLVAGGAATLLDDEGGLPDVKRGLRQSALFLRQFVGSTA